MQPVLFDTSVYISALRQGDESILHTRNVAYGSPLWLSVVVLEELYAGADTAERKQLGKLERDLILNQSLARRRKHHNKRAPDYVLAYIRTKVRVTRI